jgi:hypothetical protein
MPISPKIAPLIRTIPSEDVEISKLKNVLVGLIAKITFFPQAGV